jgi:hypothetical protein
MVQHQVQVDSDGISDGIEPVESADACYHMVNAVTDVGCLYSLDCHEFVGVMKFVRVP